MARAPHHRRYGLLVIITLGEGILGTITAVAAVVAHVGWSAEAVLIVVAGVGLTFGLWWSYFIVPSAGCAGPTSQPEVGLVVRPHGALRQRSRRVGAGLHVAAYAAEGEAVIGTVGSVLAVAIPVLIFCVDVFRAVLGAVPGGGPASPRARTGMVAFSVLGGVPRAGRRCRSGGA